MWLKSLVVVLNGCYNTGIKSTRSGKLSEQQSVDAEKEYAFDLQLAAAVRVRAKSQAQAEELVREMLETANCNAGCWPNGAPFNFEASVDGGLSLFEIDGVDVNAS